MKYQSFGYECQKMRESIRSIGHLLDRWFRLRCGEGPTDCVKRNVVLIFLCCATLLPVLGCRETSSNSDNVPSESNPQKREVASESSPSQRWAKQDQANSPKFSYKDVFVPGWGNDFPSIDKETNKEKFRSRLAGDVGSRLAEKTRKTTIGPKSFEVLHRIVTKYVDKEWDNPKIAKIESRSLSEMETYLLAYVKKHPDGLKKLESGIDVPINVWTINQALVRRQQIVDMLVDMIQAEVKLGTE